MKFKVFLKNLFTKNIVLKLLAIVFAFIIAVIVVAASSMPVEVVEKYETKSTAECSVSVDAIDLSM